MRPHFWPWLAISIATVVTTFMDFNGLIVFSAFPLIVISLAFWPLVGLTKREVGLVWGTWASYGYGLTYPLAVLSLAALIFHFWSGIQFDQELFHREYIQLLAGIVIGPLMVLLTEEGFFRGVLWGAFRKAGLNSTQTLLMTSALFMVWHISAVTSGTDYGLPAGQVPVYLINACWLGLVWGLLRMVTGSVIVPAVSHAVWNALAYTMFGYGEKIGVLGIQNTLIFGPEVGVLGILLNGLFFFWLWKKTSILRKAD